MITVKRERKTVMREEINLALGKLQLYLQQPGLKHTDAVEECRRFFKQMITIYGNSCLEIIMDICNTIRNTVSDPYLMLEKERENTMPDLMPKRGIHFSDFVGDRCGDIIERIEYMKTIKRKEVIDNAKNNNRVQIIDIEKVSNKNFKETIDIIARLPRPMIDTTVQAMLLDMSTKAVREFSEYCSNVEYNGVYEEKYRMIERCIYNHCAVLL